MPSRLARYIYSHPEAMPPCRPRPRCDHAQGEALTLQIVYEFLLRYVVSNDTDAKTAKKYIDQFFVVRA